MQLGTRWSVGSPPPSRLPDAVVDAVASVESELHGIDTSLWRWTLTWLEGRPVVELDDPSTGSGRRGTTVIRYSPETDIAAIRRLDPAEDLALDDGDDSY